MQQWVLQKSSSVFLGMENKISYWWARQGLNLRPHPCEGCALPLSYAPAPGEQVYLFAHHKNLGTIGQSLYFTNGALLAHPSQIFLLIQLQAPQAQLIIWSRSREQ